MRKLRNCIYLQILRTLAVPNMACRWGPIQPAPLTQWWFLGRPQSPLQPSWQAPERLVRAEVGGTAVTSGCHRPDLHSESCTHPHTTPSVLWCLTYKCGAKWSCPDPPAPWEVTTCPAPVMWAHRAFIPGQAGDPQEVGRQGPAIWGTPAGGLALHGASQVGGRPSSEPHPLLREGFTQDLLPRVQAVGPEGGGPPHLLLRPEQKGV